MDRSSFISSRGLVAEFIGTMGLIVVAIGSIVLPQLVWGSTLPYEFVFINAMAVGFVLFALIETLGPLSGAHFNPAVTIALTVSGECSPKKAGCYIIAQLAGALFGVLLVNVFFYDTVQSLYFISEVDRSSIYLILSEFFCTFMLVAVIFGCVRGGSDKTPLAVGLFVGGMILTTSSTMFANPAVDIARIFTNAACGIAPLSSLYFIIAGIAGAMTAAVVFGWLYPKKLKEGEKCEAFDCSTKVGAGEGACSCKKQ
ncbi:MAG: aquaporin family protein [Methanomassiliicoccaceae archaeon]|nr:aquaporin family protein [Methanomassiliicoccaceae archaeon]